MINNELRFQIVQDHHTPISVKRGEREFLQQDIYMHKGEAFPTKVILNFQNAHECLAVGFYSLCPSSYRTNQYGTLELDRFNMKFNSLEHKQLSKVS
jgi:hypothetical protein